MNVCSESYFMLIAECNPILRVVETLWRQIRKKETTIFA